MKFLKSKKGFGIGTLITFVIGIVIAVIVIPIAITEIDASAGNYSSSQQSLLNLVPLLLVVGLLIGAVVVAGLKMKK